MACSLRVISITDHDAVGGVQPALEASGGLPLEVVPGIELSAETGGREIHLLGYYISHEDGALQEKLAELRARRMIRAGKIIEKLKALGVEVDIEQVRSIADGRAIGRPHIARALIKSGYADSVSDAFEKYLGEGRSAYVPRHRLSAPDAMRVVKDAGGIPVLAHPAVSGADDLIPFLIEEGLMGIEAFYPEHSRLVADHYVALAKEKRLLVTGGSDYHGDSGSKRGGMGAALCPEAYFRQMERFQRETGG
jgi:predicted metal-dependent phosphoesterase TrpH